MRIRITFAKNGPLRYTGHLDLHKIWERTTRRADLPLSYSQGFHPQPKLQLAAALPLGFASRCEVLDMRLDEDLELDLLPARLQAALPAGIQILKVEPAEEFARPLQTLVASAEYEVTLREEVDLGGLTQRLSAVLEADSLPRVRRKKAYDLRPLIESLSILQEQPEVLLHMRLAAREGATGRPEEVLDVLGIAFETTYIERTALHFREEETA